MNSLLHFSLLLLDGSTLAEKISCILKINNRYSGDMDVARDKALFIDKFLQKEYDILIAEVAPWLADPFELLAFVKAVRKEIPFVFVGDPVYEDIALGLLAAGADDFVFTDRPQRIAMVIPRLVRWTQRERELALQRERLEKTAANLELVQSIAMIGSWEWNMQNDETIWSSQTYRLFGVEPGSITVKKGLFLDRMSPKDREAVSRIINEALEKNKPYEVEFCFTGADGKQRTVLSKGGGVYDGGGKLAGMKGTLQDITGRKAAEEACRQREYLLQKIIDNSNDIIFLKDCHSRVILANRAMEKLHGSSLDKIIGKTALEYFIDRESAERMMDGDRRIMGQNEAMVTEDRIRTKNGEEIFFTSRVPWHDENGNVMGIVGIARNITERKNLELTLEKQRAELEERNKLTLDFFINISHEFKTPISALMLALEIVSRGLETNEIDGKALLDQAEVIRRNALRLSRLVENLLDITKIDAGFMSPKLKLVDIVSLIADIVASMKSYTEQKGLKLSFLSSVDTLFAATDSQFIERIVLNIVSNAINHTATGGTIKIKLQNNKRTFTITIQDNGKGIPQDKQAIIFERFRQVDASFTRSSKGSGIGLAITKSLVELLGGRISLKSAIGKGSEFKICLPRTATDNAYSSDKDYMQMQKRIETEFSNIDFT